MLDPPKNRRVFLIVTLFNGTPVWVSGNIKCSADFYYLWKNEEQCRSEEYKKTHECVVTKVGDERMKCIYQANQTQNFRS